MRDTPRQELQIGDAWIKQVEKFIYMGRAKTNSGKIDTKIRMRFKIAKDAFQMLNELQRKTY